MSFSALGGRTPPPGHADRSAYMRRRGGVTASKYIRTLLAPEREAFFLKGDGGGSGVTRIFFFSRKDEMLFLEPIADR